MVNGLSAGRSLIAMVDTDCSTIICFADFDVFRHKLLYENVEIERYSHVVLMLYYIFICRRPKVISLSELSVKHYLWFYLMMSRCDGQLCGGLLLIFLWGKV